MASRPSPLEAYDSTDRLLGWWTFTACVLTLCAIWGLALPAISRLPFVRNDIDRLNDAKINASALYWTDLDDERLWARADARHVPIDSEHARSSAMSHTDDGDQNAIKRSHP